MRSTRTCVAALLAVAMLVSCTAPRAADATQAELEKLKQDIESIRRQLNAPPAGLRSSVDKAVEGKYGPNNAVTTRAGKLTISGLVQVWYQGVQRDSKGLFSNAGPNGDVLDTNQTQDNSTFRIRRTELKFSVDIHENVTGVVMIDPAREATSFWNVHDNQASSGIFKRVPNLSPEFDAANDNLGGKFTSVVSGVQQGSGAVPRLLQDAYINFHGVIPHHDYSVGQFKPAMGEEGIRSSAQLDFCERSFLGQLADARDLGIQLHGTWWDDRFQYWLGMFDGAGNYYQSAGQFQNRSDDNDQKDYNYRVLVRPLWKSEKWGSLELGMSSRFGRHGEAGGRNPIDAPVNGLNREHAWAQWHNAFASYMPGGPVRGLWFRGEWAYVRDRNAPQSVVNLGGGAEADPTVLQTNGWEFASQGWYASAGYKIADSIFCDKAPAFLKPFEFAVRYDTFQNVEIASNVNDNKTQAYYTSVYTAGINYYIKGHNAKIQANYNWIENPHAGAYHFHDVKNDSFVISFQVAF